MAYRVITVLNKDQFEKLKRICDKANKSPYAIAKSLLLELIEKEAKEVESTGKVEGGPAGRADKGTRRSNGKDRNDDLEDWLKQPAS